MLNLTNIDWKSILDKKKEESNIALFLTLVGIFALIYIFISLLAV